ncbi:MAG TPA: flagellar assembly peptidoglycan hydrolase FlgJ [Steroidobacteraceae bacterium]|nr:flagellar assembly peptidoglycan hydrolase FlgJ [Steroidobacteraceae bacterium]
MTSPLTTSSPATSPVATALSPVPPSQAAAAQANTYTDLNALAALKNAPGSPATIKAVSEQVEAMFLQMMLQSMREASEADGEQTSNEMGMYQDMFDKQVALTLSKRQDLGIARLFERQLGGERAQLGGEKALPAGGKAAPAGGKLPLSPAAGAGPAGQSRPAHTASNTEPDGRASASAAGPSLYEQAAQFVGQVLPTIRSAAATLGVNPMGLLAQAALETGWGQRMPRTADGNSSLNLFGIKAGSEWGGARAVADTVEISGGIATQRRTAFRAYGSIEESVRDFANLLATSPRYREAVAAGASAQAYVQSIARAGYATDPDYGNKLNQVLNGGTLRAALSARLAQL